MARSIARRETSGSELTHSQSPSSLFMTLKSGTSRFGHDGRADSVGVDEVAARSAGESDNDKASRTSALKRIGYASLAGGKRLGWVPSDDAHVIAVVVV